MQEFSTLQDVEFFAAQQGVVLTPGDKARIRAAQQAERDRLAALAADEKPMTWADKFNAFYPTLLRAVVSIGDTLMTLSQTFIVSLGVPLVLVLLLIVEHRRVVHGIELFEVEYALASFAAWALVLLNLVLEFQVHHVEHKEGYIQARDTRWSLRIWARNMAYRLGLGDEWQALELSPAARYRRLLRLVTFSILALALAGSMRTVIEQQPGVWHVALISIITDSTLIEMSTWAGGLLFAMAAVLSAQGLSQYVAIRCVEILARMEEAQAAHTTPYAAEIEQAGATVALAMVNEKLTKKAAKSTARPAIDFASMNTDEEDTDEVATIRPT